jgi:hypothetical protein
MANDISSRRMILCGGSQSGGTTLVSWCFLQRQDTNGILDMSHDLMRYSFDRVIEPIVWVKMTIGAFRFLDVYETYRDMGWNPEPLLVVRDIRAAYASLMKKSYGFNGCTAEEPPLRMRFRRFLLDWELFREREWPVMKFEDLLQDERTMLVNLCDRLGLPWDEGMIAWQKNTWDIAYVDSPPNATFASSVDKSASLAQAKLQDKAYVGIDSLPKAELDWLEETFGAYNQFHGYPPHMRCTGNESLPSMASPSYIGTQRQWYYDEHVRLNAENERLRTEIDRLSSENERLRSVSNV